MGKMENIVTEICEYNQLLVVMQLLPLFSFLHTQKNIENFVFYVELSSCEKCTLESRSFRKNR